MSPWEHLIEQPHARGHFVQLYRTGDGSLAKNVGQYLGAGLNRGDGVLIIVTPEHRDLFCRQLDQMNISSDNAIRQQQLVILDAQETLSEFMRDGQPDWNLFEKIASRVLRKVQPTSPTGGLRAYGEMVGVLWKARQFAAAARLEQLWNKLLEQSSFSLYCAYAVDVFGTEFQLSNLDAVLCTHTHLIPAESNGYLGSALDLAMDEVFGADAESLKTRIKADHRAGTAVMPNAESTLLWLRRNCLDRADDVISRARAHYALMQSHSPAV